MLRNHLWSNWVHVQMQIFRVIDNSVAVPISAWLKKNYAHLKPFNTPRNRFNYISRTYVYIHVNMTGSVFDFQYELGEPDVRWMSKTKKDICKLCMDFNSLYYRLLRELIYLWMHDYNKRNARLWTYIYIKVILTCFFFREFYLLWRVFLSFVPWFYKKLVFQENISLL